MGFGNTVKDGTGDFWHNLCDSVGRLIVSDPWSNNLEQDLDADLSVKVFTVDANTRWKIDSIYVDYTSTADVGDRQLSVEFLDSSNAVLLQIRLPVTQAASLQRFYNIARGLPAQDAFYDTDVIMFPLPDIELTAGWKIKVYDINAVAAAADDMEVTIIYREKSV